MQYYYRDPAQNPGMMNTTGQYNPTMNATQPQLESMYPNTYYVVQPAVENACNNLAAKKGEMYTPNQEEIENMINEVYSKVENDVENIAKKSPYNTERQFFGGGRFLLRDLIAVLLIASLIRRRPHHSFGPGGYPYSGGYYGGGYWPYGWYMY